MKEKIEFLLRNKGLSSTQLARLLEIQPSAVSHILSGRNKPSFDLVVKILRAFPEINPDWLLLDGEHAFRSTEQSAPLEANSLPISDASLFEQANNIEISQGLDDVKNETMNIFTPRNSSHKSVKRVIVLYADNTFESYDNA